jgi:diguanylate cyclase (GGDEF)-like protein
MPELTNTPQPATIVPAKGFSPATTKLVANLATKPRRLHNRLIYLVESDQTLIKQVSLRLKQRGYQVQVFTQLKHLPKAISQQPPAAIIIEVMLSEGEWTAPKVVLGLQKNRPTPLPVIFISSRVDMTARLVAARANGHAYFDKPLNINALIEKLDQLTALADREAYRILIVDDTGKYADKYVKILQSVNMRTLILRDPMKIIEALSKAQPTLILINAQLLGLNALELTVTIRQQEKSNQIPIIFLAQPLESLRQTTQRGVVDDFLSEAESPEQVIATVTNCIKNAERYGQLQELINRDLLTGLYNRRYLLSQLEVTKPSDSTYPLTVLYIHLDNLHSAGKIMALSESDAIIIDTAKLLREQMNQHDLLARLNDRVFVILSFNRTLEEVKKFAETIRAKLEQRVVKVNEVNLLTTCSIGIGIYHQQTNAQQALLDADLACTQAREQGQAGTRIQLHDTVVDHLQKTDRVQLIRAALNNRQLYLAYQPIASVHGEAYEYYDVLLRMHSSTGGEGILPTELIFVAEQSGLILQIDRWVITQAVLTAAEKHQAGQPVNFFVRLSGASLSDATLFPWLQKILADKSLSPASIIFDVPHTVVSQRLPDTQHFMSYIKALGCRFALRDFDDKPDTLQLLNSLAVDFVKIKGSLVQGLTQDSENLTAIRTILKTVHRQNKLVIAPFVEDADKLSLLYQYDIDYIAGYFVQAPGNQLDYDFTVGV